ncbi:MAG: hypothetical protein C5B49_06945, partial [Bdellovibrio sp.]
GPIADVFKAYLNPLFRGIIDRAAKDGNKHLGPEALKLYLQANQTPLNPSTSQMAEIEKDYQDSQERLKKLGYSRTREQYIKDMHDLEAHFAEAGQGSQESYQGLMKDGRNIWLDGAMRTQLYAAQADQYRQSTLQSQDSALTTINDVIRTNQSRTAKSQNDGQGGPKSQEIPRWKQAKLVEALGRLTSAYRAEIRKPGPEAKLMSWRREQELRKIIGQTRPFDNARIDLALKRVRQSQISHRAFISELAGHNSHDDAFKDSIRGGSEEQFRNNLRTREELGLDEHHNDNRIEVSRLSRELGVTLTPDSENGGPQDSTNDRRSSRRRLREIFDRANRADGIVVNRLGTIDKPQTGKTEIEGDVKDDVRP